MAVTIRAENGDRDWGGAPFSNVEAVALSAAGCFPVFDDGESIAITLQARTTGPMTVTAPSPPEGEAIVWLTTQGNVWDKIAFQFAHEFCHVMADPSTFPWDRWAWIEESICEMASLFALRAMAKKWATVPPYPNWQPYAVDLEEYAKKHASERDHCLPSGIPFRTWLGAQMPLLFTDAANKIARREDNTIIGKELLPIFESDPKAWNAVRHLHAWPRPAPMTVAEFFEAWTLECPAEYQHAAVEVRNLLDVEP
jgi:hypothetical protein